MIKFIGNYGNMEKVFSLIQHNNLTSDNPYITTWPKYPCMYKMSQMPLQLLHYLRTQKPCIYKMTKMPLWPLHCQLTKILTSRNDRNSPTTPTLSNNQNIPHVQNEHNTPTTLTLSSNSNTKYKGRDFIRRPQSVFPWTFWWHK